MTGWVGSEDYASRVPLRFEGVDGSGSMAEKENGRSFHDYLLSFFRLGIPIRWVDNVGSKETGPSRDRDS
jgi:hypothetical protein